MQPLLAPSVQADCDYSNRASEGQQRTAHAKFVYSLRRRAAVSAAPSVRVSFYFTLTVSKLCTVHYLKISRCIHCEDVRCTDPCLPHDQLHCHARFRTQIHERTQLFSFAHARARQSLSPRPARDVRALASATQVATHGGVKLVY